MLKKRDKLTSYLRRLTILSASQKLHKKNYGEGTKNRFIDYHLLNVCLIGQPFWFIKDRYFFCSPLLPEAGIALEEEFSYKVEVKEGVMNLTFKSEGHPTKTFSKNLIDSEYKTEADIPKQVQKLFFPIGQDGVERKNAYAKEGLFFKLGSYNQTNGKSPQVNRVWCSGAETHGGDLQKQYVDGNYAEVWFKSAYIEISNKAISNEGYFSANDGLSEKTVYPSEVIPFMDKFKILMGDGSKENDLMKFENKDFFYL